MRGIPSAVVLEDGAVFRGRSFGAPVEGLGEIVFNTSFCGYQEIVTDPSYRDQIVCMAFPAMGNYGTEVEFIESSRIQAAGLVVGDAAEIVASARCSLGDYLHHGGVPGIENVDTRALVRRIREKGAMRATLVADYREKDLGEYLMRARSILDMEGRDLVSDFMPLATTHNPKGSPRIGLLDCGAKLGIVRSLVSRGCRVDTLSVDWPVDRVLGEEFDGIVLSNGPGDPAALSAPVEIVRGLLGRIPLMGICLGHQILARAAGGRTFKLAFGHRGANHPVIEHATGRIRITSQNHGFAVDPASLPEGVQATESNLYDGTNEAIEIRGAGAFSVQYHPEARPGPRDAEDHFERFLRMVKHAAPR